MYICAPHVCLLPTEVRRHRTLSTEIADGCMLPCGCWELNLGALEQQVLLIAEPHACSQDTHTQMFYGIHLYSSQEAEAGGLQV